MSPPRWAAVLWMIALVGCGDRDTSVPPTVYFGQDTCASCAMIVSDERFAAVAWADDAGQPPLAFDDVGCLLAMEGREGARWAAAWVHDFHDDAWLPLSEAVFVHGDRLRSPMAFGVAALPDHAAAADVVRRRGGEVLTLDQIRPRHASGELRIDPQLDDETASQLDPQTGSDRP